MNGALNEGFRDWLAGLGRREIGALAVLAVLVAGGAAFWYVRSLPRPVAVRALTPRVAEPSPSPAPVVVHVAGWVRRPGVYEFQEGDRVIDAIDRAGGPRRGAELSALNLAAVLVDAQQVLVPRRAPAARGPGGGPGGATVPGTGAPALVNVNVATAEQLEALPGIGEVLAARIIDYRERNGPFASVDDLVNVSGIGEQTLANLRDLVTV